MTFAPVGMSAAMDQRQTPGSRGGPKRATNVHQISLRRAAIAVVLMHGMIAIGCPQGAVVRRRN
jgi:hypothetical protein